MVLIFIAIKVAKRVIRQRRARAAALQLNQEGDVVILANEERSKHRRHHGHCHKHWRKHSGSIRGERQLVGVQGEKSGSVLAVGVWAYGDEMDDKDDYEGGYRKVVMPEIVKQ